MLHNLKIIVCFAGLDCEMLFISLKKTDNTRPTRPIGQLGYPAS